MPTRTVLHVDDSPDDVLLLKLASSAANVSLEFQSAENGDKAIAYLRGLPPYGDRLKFPLPNLILLDLKMPGKSGFDVLEWIHSQRNLQHIPVVIFSSSVHEPDQVRAFELGAKHYLVKPADYVELQRLVQNIDRLLTSHGSWDGLGP